MSDILAAIDDDMEEYKELCRKYGEKPQYRKDFGWLVDAYCEHATALKERDRRNK